MTRLALALLLPILGAVLVGYLLWRGAFYETDSLPPHVEVEVDAPAPAPAEPVATVKETPVSLPVPTSVARELSGPLVRPTDETWDAIAACESGGDWADRRGGYEGGVHFMPDTWRRAGGHRFALHAYDATREQQIEIANDWLARTSWRQWPVCSRKVGVR